MPIYQLEMVCVALCMLNMDVPDHNSNSHLLFAAGSVSIFSTTRQYFSLQLTQRRAIAVAIGQSVLTNRLVREVPRRTSAVPPQAVITNGALNLQRLTNSALALKALREAYAKAIQNLLIYSLVAVCVALPFALGMQWLNLKKAAKKTQMEDANEQEHGKLLGTETQAMKT